MDKQDAALDASFWINGHRGGLLDFLLDYFDLFVPSIVVKEIEYSLPTTGELTPAGALFQAWRHSGHITVQDPQRLVDWFHTGENAAIALAIERNCALLIDDNAPYHFAKSQGLTVIGTPDLVVMLYAWGQLDYDRALAIMRHLRAHKHLTRTAMIMLELLARTKGEQ